MNNKIKTILFTLIILMTGAKAYAYDFEVKNADGITLYYNYINNGTELEVTYLYYNYKRVIASNSGGKIVIPKEVNFMNRTRMVTRIGERAFPKIRNYHPIHD